MPQWKAKGLSEAFRDKFRGRIGGDFLDSKRKQVGNLPGFSPQVWLKPRDYRQ